MSLVCTSTHQTACLHVFDLLLNVLLQAHIWLESRHLPERLGSFEICERFSAHTMSGVDESHHMMEACLRIDGYATALGHEIESL